ncbi:ATP-grasp domain-containing protein [Enterovibrio norvegicus]|uniref:ATP-grasp domain-containing protein n=1 Tax=Enterovibrio norvegicus TaxID=188144 RepID=UPI00352FCC6C
MKNNLLILSAGRRVELVQAFQNDLKELNINAQVYCTDMSPELSSACQIADESFKVPRVTDPSYLSTIESLCLENGIRLVIPTIDTELLLLAEAREAFFEKGVEIVISSTPLISECRDKRKTADLFSRLQVDQPAIYNKADLTFPCFCKPYDGSCSVGAIALPHREALTQDLLDNPKNMFMELIPKTYCEYTIDAYYSGAGELKSLVPRKRLEVRGGEVSKGVTRKNFVYDYLLSRVETLPGARGCITFQLFVNEDTQQVKGLEINPRFGGGFPLSYDAGARFPKWLIEEYLMGRPAVFSDNWEANLVMLRYDAKVLVRESE